MSTQRLSIRRELRPADRAAVRAMAAGSGFFSAAEVAIAVELFDARLARGDESGYLFLLAEIAGLPAGFACHGPIAGTEQRFDLYWIVVRDDLRGQGLGRELLEAVEADVRARGGRRIYVDTSTRPQYEPTRRYYERAGYRLEAELPDFYSPGDGKAIFLKVLAPG